MSHVLPMSVICFWTLEHYRCIAVYKGSESSRTSATKKYLFSITGDHESTAINVCKKNQYSENHNTGLTFTMWIYFFFCCVFFCIINIKQKFLVQSVYTVLASCNNCACAGKELQCKPWFSPTQLPAKTPRSQGTACINIISVHSKNKPLNYTHLLPAFAKHH